MTREQIDAIERTYKSAEIDALCDLALEALELREALEWMASEQCELGCTPSGIYVLSCMQQDKWATIHGEGSTPLEAIQNARRGA